MFKGKRGVDSEGVEWRMGRSGQVMNRKEMWTEACREGKTSGYWEQGGALHEKGRANVSALLKKEMWPSWRSVRTAWLQINERKRERDVGGWTDSNYTVCHKPWFKEKGFGLLKGQDFYMPENVQVESNCDGSVWMLWAQWKAWVKMCKMLRGYCSCQSKGGL